MNQQLNPWITETLSGHMEQEDVALRHSLPPATGVMAPLRGMVEPDAADRLLRRAVSGTSTLWITGVHGGAGETRLAGILDGARATGRAWPVANEPQHAPRVLLVCRSDMRGLKAAQSALIEWVSGASPEIDLLGLAIMADAPGKLPKALREFAAVVSGGAPRGWMLPWVEAWRLGAGPDGPPGREYQRFITDLTTLAN